jgi:hypothetical protein
MEQAKMGTALAATQPEIAINFPHGKTPRKQIPFQHYIAMQPGAKLRNTCTRNT